MRAKYFLIFGLILLIGFASATYNLGDEKYSYSDVYGPDSDFAGWFNISFTNVPLDSVFSDNFGNSITLEKLLATSANSGYTHTCDRVGCYSIYESSEPALEKSFVLNEGESKLFGFEFTGDIDSFNSAEFQIVSDATASCSNQLKIDIFDDNSIETGNIKKAVTTCEDKEHSCFDESRQQTEIAISSTPICQRFIFEEAPGFELGAWVKEVTAGTKKISMSLVDLAGKTIKTCNLSSEDINSTGKEASCEIEYLIKEPTEYYVCMSASAGDGEYKTQGYSSPEDACGFFGNPVKLELNAYQMFVQKTEFDSIGTLTIENDLGLDKNFSEQIESYIKNEYGDLDCTNGCLVPIRFISNQDQSITIKNLKINYVGNLGLVEEKNFHDFDLDASKITSSFQKLFFDLANFSLPSEFRDHTYRIFFDGDRIFDERISVEDISIDIYPKILPVIFETTITASIEVPNKIQTYNWNFGDGTNSVTTINSVTHSYLQEGTYTLTLELKDIKNNIFSKSFNVEVNNSKEIIQAVVEKTKKNLGELELKMLDLDVFTRDSLKKYLKVNEVKALLDSIESNLTASSDETEFKQYIQPLLDINLPSNFVKSSTSKISYYPSEELINLNILEEVQNENDTVGYETEYRQAILGWYYENLDTQITMTDIYFVMDEGTLPNLRSFILDISKKETGLEGSDVVIKDLSDLTFKSNYDESLVEGFYTFKPGTISQLQFSTSEDVAFQNLPLFISPKLSSVFIPSGEIMELEEPGKPLIFFLLLAILAVLAIAAYFLIHRWYVRRYENHLFPDRNNLFNLINYVNTSKEKGMSIEDIRRGLKKVGWTSEQIHYVLKKHEGKEVGMPGLSKSIVKGQNLNK